MSYRQSYIRRGLSPESRLAMEAAAEGSLDENLHSNVLRDSINYEGMVAPHRVSQQTPNANANPAPGNGAAVMRVRLQGRLDIYPDESDLTGQDSQYIRKDLDNFYNCGTDTRESMPTNPGLVIQMQSFGNDPSYDGSKNNLRFGGPAEIGTYSSLNGAGLLAGGGNVPVANLNWNNSRTADYSGAPGDISSIIKKRKSSKGSFGTQFKYYFPVVAEQRLKQLLTDMNAYVSQRGHDIEFFNFGIIRDIEAAMVGGAGRSKGSNHGFGLAIDALVKATGKKASAGSGIVTKQFTLNGKLTSSIKGNYHSRNKVIIQDHALMKVLDDFSKLPKNKDITWGGRFKRGTAHEIPGVGTLYTMELHHWEISKSALPDYWEPYKTHLNSVGISQAPTTTSQNLAAMEALWAQYQREQMGSNVLAMNTTENDTAQENLRQGAE